MRKHILLTAGKLILATAWAATGLQAQTKPPASGRPGMILVDTDDACRLVLDGQDQGVVKPDEAKKIAVVLGDHVIKCTIEGMPEVTTRKAVNVKDSNQVAVLLSLKPMHDLYEEQAAKLAKSKESDSQSMQRPSEQPKSSAVAKPSVPGAPDLVPSQSVPEGTPPGDADALAALGDAAENRKDYAAARDLYLRACNAGSAGSCEMMYHGEGIGTADMDTGEAFFQKEVALRQALCDAGKYVECNALGLTFDIIYSKDFLHGDRPRAESYYLRACQGGLAVACSNLALIDGVTAQQSKGSEKKAAERLAKFYYQKACDMGGVDACGQIKYYH